MSRILPFFLSFCMISIVIGGNSSFVTFSQKAAVKRQAPQIFKIEPPNWWVSSNTRQLTILLTGSDFAGATVASETNHITITKTRISAGGNYLFLDIVLNPALAAGNYGFKVTTPNGTATWHWAVQEPLPRTGNFQGLAASDVVYLIMPDRFADGDPKNNEPLPGVKTYDPQASRMYHGGDLRGLIEHLDYLKELGVTAIWLTPIVDNNDAIGQDYHGYGMTDFYTVEAHFGTLADYQELARELHKRGMKLIQDTVPNHTGPTHPWVKTPPTASWYNGTPEKHSDCNFDIPALANPNSSKKKRRLATDGWFAGILPDINGRDPEVVTYMAQEAIWWTHQSGQDALRLDTYPYVDRSFWRDWQKRIDAEFPALTDFGEVFNGDPKVISFFLGGKTGWDGIDTGLKTQFDFPLMYALRDFCFNDTKGADRISETLAQDGLYGDASKLVTFVGNHDITRIMHEAKGDARRVNLAHALLLTLRGVPQLYYGDEIGIDGAEDPDNRRDFPGGFGGSNNAFTPTGRTLGQASLWNETNRLLRIRREHPALHNGAQQNLVVSGKSFAFLRQNKQEMLVVIANGKAQTAKLTLPATKELAPGRKLQPLDGSLSTYEVSAKGVDVSLEPFGYQIFLVK
ncbi:MAG: cyclomaltodextrinase N-terminal domain-containing protein [Blastocatellia bacterium]|nr:cyclomaltodextrinase N-terminal domain-containing protein [Blastocatellia bacterium]